MVYVMSDLHGDYDKYIKMLQKIDFGDDDLLYILGDVIDRGKEGMKILQDMMLRSNVMPMLGNHEYMAYVCLSWLSKEITEDNVNNIDQGTLQGLAEWMNEGGEATIAEFCKLAPEERVDIVEYLSEFELYNVVEVNGKTFILVHAGLQNFSPDRDLDDYALEEMIFCRQDYDLVCFEDKILVTGHTPTRIIYALEKGISVEEISDSQFEDSIFKKNNHIAIDCGCGHGGSLGCICLDTMEEYYV